ncbi:transcriptional regulator [Chitiniphilus eburneus]|uniref:helix-turn-helix domain-containing protein n=1 Tax=Chitiniphilus eburneus TaxID=2571148 RepID=UPI0035CFCB2F
MTKKTAITDWHPADVVCALRKRGWSLRQLSLHHGYSHGATLKTALRRRYPKAERLIADALGLAPSEIWPSRYPAAGHQRQTPRDVLRECRDFFDTSFHPASVSNCDERDDVVAA